MTLSVFTYSYRKRFYLTHPWKFIKETWQNFRAAWMRATKGYCYRDVWNFCDWLPRVIAPMIRHLGEYGCGYPANEEFKTFEQWRNWLKSVADVLEATLEDEWDGQNEYEELWEKASCALYPYSNITTTNDITKEDAETIRKMYWDRELELSEERIKLQKDALNEIIIRLPQIWD